jgi:hypothetical protein
VGWCVVWLFVWAGLFSVFVCLVLKALAACVLKLPAFHLFI